MEHLDYIELATNEKPDSCVIWLHGLGADGHDFANIVPELNLPKDLGIHFIFPHAPIQPVTINGGYPMRAWFDIFGLNETARQDDIGIRKGQQLIESLIHRILKKGIPSERIILAGFSQGGALALHCALRSQTKLAGIIALSTFLPLAKTLDSEKELSNRVIPIFMAHGNQDIVVPFRLGELSRNALINLGYHVDWHEYAMGHAVCPQEVKDIGFWLKSILARQVAT